MNASLNMYAAQQQGSTQFGRTATQMIADVNGYEQPRVRSAPTWERPTLSYTRSLGIMPEGLLPMGSAPRPRGRDVYGKTTAYRAEPRYKWGTTRNPRMMHNRPLQQPSIVPGKPRPVIFSLPVNVTEANKCGAHTGDRKHRGTSRNNLGGFFTS